MLTYALCSQQQLIREVEINDEQDDANYAADNSAASGNMDGEEGVIVTLSEEEATDNTNDRNRWNDHAPPCHDDTSELKVQAEQKAL